MTPTDLATGLVRLDGAMSQVGAPVVPYLRPGLPTEQVRSTLTAAGLGAPAELLTWFGWHDGAEPPGGMIGDRPNFTAGAGLHCGWEMQPLAGCLTLRPELKEYDEDMALDPELAHLAIPGSWLPVLMLDNAIFACADAGVPGAEPDQAAVYVVDAQLEPEAWHRPRWPSLAAWVDDVLLLHDSGSWAITAGHIHSDFSQGYPPGLHERFYL